MAVKATKVRHFKVELLKINGPWRNRWVTLSVDGKVCKIKKGDNVIITHRVEFSDGEVD